MPGTKIEDKYQKKTQHEHILIRPDTYMDTIKNDKLKIYIFDDNKNKIVLDERIINAGLYKIFDEILVNASDQTIRDNTCDTIKVNINKETGEIIISNNSCSKTEQIPIEMHKKEKVYVPELIFGHLLTGSNFEDDNDNKRVVGGKNGYGAKLTNIYSTKFEIEVLNTNNKKKYTQLFENNMYKKSEPDIKKSSSKDGYTKISFIPDYKRFGCKGLSEDMFLLFKKRTYDIAGTTSIENKVKVYFNDELLNINSFEDYIKMFYDDEIPPSVYQDVNKRWSVGVLFDDKSGYRQVSYVNRISTFAGGKHVDYIMDQIIKRVIEKIKKKHKDLMIKPSLIKDNVTLFINSTIGNPNFDSQSKKKLTTKEDEWIDDGFPCVLNEKFIEKLCKTGIIEEVTRSALSKQEAELNKMNSKKTNTMRGIPKLNDALLAGSKKSDDCTLILTEGDSAKAFAISGLTVIGNEKYGVFPLKGKLLNVRKLNMSSKSDIEKLSKNEEIENIIKILGLKHKTVYEDTKKLRYGKILILTDQDDDGHHIKGLLMNMLHRFWSSLLKLDFIQSMATPLIKAYKNGKNKDPVIFYNIFELKKWEEKHDVNKYKLKFFKGLGTSSPAEAKECFKDYDKKVITYKTDDNKKNNDCKSLDSETDDLSKTDKAIILAFGDKQEDARKEWVKVYDDKAYIDTNNKEVYYDDFINKELIHFSHSDNLRSIPDVCDGLKPSQRKVLYSCFKRNLKQEIKVAQLAGYVSENSGYHHGEASLNGTIINMAQNYCGSNNINLLMPNGQFGSRRLMGKDHASPRYIFTELNKITDYIFRKEDEAILEFKIDDGDMVEPYRYYPVIPMVLVNGTEGIGTGYSSNVPLFNPLDIIKNVKLFLDDKKLIKLIPWYKNYNGEIKENKKKDKKKNEIIYYNIKGKYEIINENTILIKEIPINVSIENYKEKLENFLIIEDKKIIKKDKQNVKDIKKKDEDDLFIEEYKEIINKGMDEDTINIQITLKNNVLQKFIKNNLIEKMFKLESTISINNMHLYENNVITKYNNPNEIIEKYSKIRLEKYEERRKYIIKYLENELEVLFYKKKYIQQVLDDIIIIKHQKRSAIIDRLIELKYPELSISNGENKSYDYLTGFLLFSLTKEKIEELMNKYDKAKEELEFYKNTTAKDIWLKELKELEEVYNEFINEKTVKVKKTKKTK